MFQKDETQNIREFPTRINDFLWNFESVVSKKDAPYPMETWGQSDPLSTTKVISWKNVSKMEDTKRSLAGHFDQL